MKLKTAVLLINLGTPDSPSVKDVRKYLFQFLNDPRVIDISALARFLLVNLIIVPFRAVRDEHLDRQAQRHRHVVRCRSVSSREGDLDAVDAASRKLPALAIMAGEPGAARRPGSTIAGYLRSRRVWSGGSP